MNMDFSHTSLAQRTQLTADKRALKTIGILFALVTLIVVGAAGLAVWQELGTAGDLIERAGIPHITAIGT